MADAKRYWCPNGHSFDRAKAGYVNLLLANQKKSKEPGDSREMIRSRQAFLSQGHYQPLASALAELIGKHRSDSAKTLLDVGCGEGYYLNFLHEAHPQLECYGIDISKEAVQRAAKQSKEIEVAVASAAQLPVQDESVDLMLNVFSPRYLSELARIAKPNALLISATPASNHLLELREMIYDEVRDYELLADDAFEPEFTLVDSHTVSYQINLENSEDIANLLQMTPFYWHTAAEKQGQLMALEELKISISFALSVWSIAKTEIN
jgi:23S rRNA (guanine745-N1)-methyltransferase